MGGFQSVINDYQAPGVEGDFASTNPYATVLAGPGSLVAPVGGVKVGRFVWVGPAGQVSASYVAGYQIGFLGRNQQALITDFLGESTLTVPEGFMITLFNGGDFWAKFRAGATAGGYVFADPNDGEPVYSATNSAPALGAATAQSGSTISSATTTAASAVLTVTTITHGNVLIGDEVVDTGAPGTYITVGTTIINQLTGPAGGAGTYTMSAPAASAGVAFAAKTTSGEMLVTAIASGSLNQGDIFSGTNVIAGSSVLSQVTPFSGVGSLATSTVLTVTSVTPGTDLLRVGAIVVMLGVAAGTTISAQTSGAPGGVGTYTLSAASTITQAGVPVTTADSMGGTGLYLISPAGQNFGASSAAETITVAGTAQATGFRVRGTYTAAQAPANGGIWKISTL